MAEKRREVKELENKVKALENELLLEKPLAKTRRILWDNIGQSITDMWKSIQVIHEEMDLVAAAQEEIQRTRDSLGNMPE